MPSLRTPRKKQNRSKTYRSRRPMKGGLRDDLKALIDSKQMTPTIINPQSKFVVVTYWWGAGNLNKNTQVPCISDIQELWKEGVWEEFESEDMTEDFPEIQEVKDQIETLKTQLIGDPTNEALQKELNINHRKFRHFFDEYMQTQKARERMNKSVTEQYNAQRSKGEGRDPIKFEAMIKMWEDHHRSLNCNFMAMNYEFERKDYQVAINAKPYFIEKALEACGGRAVVYIDGDMFFNKYGQIFDTPDVDFMARGWNIDPRGAPKFKTDVCFDPYILETSGGLMYFGNTPKARKILKEWDETSSLPINAGKADDRIVSMVLTHNNWAVRASIIQLPIEYLWLTNIYETHTDLMSISKYCDPIVEHPACLTSEDTATESTATSSRQPDGYATQVENLVVCEREGGVFYEYVFFPNKTAVASFRPYLKYMRSAKNFTTNKPLFNVVGYDAKYGDYNEVASKNIKDAQAIRVSTQDLTVKLPPDASIPTILANLLADKHVQVGEDSRPLEEETDIRGKNTAVPSEQGLITKVQLDTASPIYFSHDNPIVRHLVAMCGTLGDLNKHLLESYIFTSRIRWSLVSPPPPFSAGPIGPPSFNSQISTPFNQPQISTA